MGNWNWLRTVLVLALGLALAWTATPLWAGENLPPSAAATGIPSLQGRSAPSRNQGAVGISAATASTVPTRLAPGQVPTSPPTFNYPRQRVFNPPWTPSVRADPDSCTYSCLDGGLSVTGPGKLITAYNWCTDGGASWPWRVCNSTDYGATWTARTLISGSGLYQFDDISCANKRDSCIELVMKNVSGYTLYFVRSTNSGVSWRDTLFIPQAGSGSGVDYPKIDQRGPNLLVGYYNTSGNGYIGVCRSTDWGATWNASQVYVSNATGQGNCPRFSKPPSTNAYFMWGQPASWQPSTVWFNRSVDLGATWGTPTQILALSMSSHFPSTRISHTFPVMDAAPNGDIYCVVQDMLQGNGWDVAFIKSTDNGTTWSTPVRVNDDVSTPNADQLEPWVEVDQYGIIHVFWMDNRNYYSTNTYALDVYYSYSMDRGATWSTNEKVNDISPISSMSSDFSRMGDYQVIDSDPTHVYCQWTQCNAAGTAGSDFTSSRLLPAAGPFHDVAIPAIVTPGPKVDPLVAIAPVVRVQNYGTYRETNVPVRFRVDSSGTQLYNQLMTVATLDSGASVNVTFPNWTPGPGGVTYNLTAYHSYSPDTNRTNDTLRTTTQTRVHEISTVSSSIGSRVRALSPVTPQLTLGNPGDYTERGFNATCWIDSAGTRLYNQTVAVDSVVAYGTRTVAFPVWNTGPVGAIYNLTFFNSFSDPNRGNDTLHVATQASNQSKALIAFGDLNTNSWALRCTLVAHDSSSTFSVIDTINVSSNGGRNLSLSSLITGGYGVVLTFANYTYLNATALGDTLAAFMDQGGGVVIAPFGEATTWGIGGRYATQYMPVPLTANSYLSGTLGTVDRPTHPIMQGVSSISIGNYVTGATTLQHGYRVAAFNNGHVLAGCFDTLGRRSAVVGFFPTCWFYTGWGPHNARLLLNAMCWAAGLCNESGVEVLPPIGNMPRIFALASARPNPLRGTTEIRYQLPTSGPVRITVFNVAGQAVRTLVDAKEDAGYKSVTWNGRNDRGARVGPGVYLYRMEAGAFTATKKMVVVR